MEITREIVTVLANPTTNQVHIILSGYRIVLTTDEAHSLARALNRLGRPSGDATEAATGEPSLATNHPAADTSGARHLARASLAEAESVQQRAHALIQGIRRDQQSST